MSDPQVDDLQFPRYDQGRFIERNEIAVVLEQVKRAVEGREEDVQAIDFRGEPGAGKTWLLRHLAEAEVSPDSQSRQMVGNALGNPAAGGTPKVHSIYVNLEEWSSHPNATVEAIAKKLVIALDQTISSWADIQPTTQFGGGDQASLGDLSRWLEADIRTLLGSRSPAVVVLFDHAHESPWPLLKLLDDHIFGPLSGIRRVFIVTAGRGSPYPWEATSLRLHTKTVELQPFDIERTRLQLVAQINREFTEEEAKDIVDRTEGYPRSNYALGVIGKENWPEAIGAELEYLLESEPDPQHRQRLREYLEALCVLMGFREDQIMPMLASYFQDPTDRDRPSSEATEIREDLREHGFIFWDNTKPAMWKIHLRLRTLLVSRLEFDRPLWIRMHCTAYAMFSDWSKRYENTREHWRREADHHQQELGSLQPPASLADCKQ